jgi:hypothetical protein
MQTTTATSPNDKKSPGKHIPAWLPISLVRFSNFSQTRSMDIMELTNILQLQLTVTTAALAVPMVLFRRQRSKALLNSLPPRRTGDPSRVVSRFTPVSSMPSSNGHQNQWPPPRRTSGTKSLQGFGFSPRASAASMPPTGVQLGGLRGRAVPNDEFNAPLHSAKAFGLATLIVAICASTAVWGLMTSLDVRNVRPITPIDTSYTDD